MNNIALKILLRFLKADQIPKFNGHQAITAKVLILFRYGDQRFKQYKPTN